MMLGFCQLIELEQVSSNFSLMLLKGKSIQIFFYKVHTEQLIELSWGGGLLLFERLKFALLSESDF